MNTKYDYKSILLAVFTIYIYIFFFIIIFFLPKDPSLSQGPLKIIGTCQLAHLNPVLI